MTTKNKLDSTVLFVATLWFDDPCSMLGLRAQGYELVEFEYWGDETLDNPFGCPALSPCWTVEARSERRATVDVDNRDSEASRLAGEECSRLLAWAEARGGDLNGMDVFINPTAKERQFRAEW